MLTLHSLYIVSPTIAVGELCILPPGAVECTSSKAYCTHPSSCGTVEQIWCHKDLAGCWLPLSVSSGLGCFPLSLFISCDVFNQMDGMGGLVCTSCDCSLVDFNLCNMNRRIDYF